MTYKIVIEPRAIVDAQKAMDYYDGKQIGLGEKFNSALNKHIESISKNPFYQIRYKDYRALPINKFPYIIFFYIKESESKVFIIGIFNTNQHPDKYPD